MGLVGGPRHHGTGPKPLPWKCPACQAENVGVMEEGCNACGANTAATNARAQKGNRPVEPKIPVERIAAQVVADKDIDPGWFLKLAFLTPQAKTTIAVALLRYAESITATTSEELPRGIVLAWGELLQRELGLVEGDEP